MEDLKNEILKELEDKEFLWLVEVVRIFAKHEQFATELKDKIELFKNNFMSFPGVSKINLIDFFENQPADEEKPKPSSKKKK